MGILWIGWSYACHPSSEVVILLHGLEACATPYITGSAKHSNTLALMLWVNYRGCSVKQIALSDLIIRCNRRFGKRNKLHPKEKKIIPFY